MIERAEKVPILPPWTITDRNVRCLFIIDTLDGFAGTEKHLYQLTTRLSNRGFVCRVVVFKSQPSVVMEFERAGIPVITLHLLKIYGSDALRKFVRLVSIIRRFKPHIVQTYHFNSDTFGVCAARIARGSKVISSRRDMGDLKTNRQVALNRVVNPLIDYFISVCDRVGTSLSLVEGIPAAKIKTIYNGVELSMYRSGPEARLNARKKLGIDCGVFVVGMVCRLRPEKDIGLFLRAVAAVARKSGNMLAMVVGDWDRKDQGMVDQYFQYLREAGVDKKVIFTGFIDDIRDYVDSMDVVCLTPGKNEGLSNSLLEKMAMGKAVIATDVGGNEELVVHGETGFIISPADEDALVESILTLKENPQLRTAMGANGRRRIEGYFTVQKMIENTEALYRTLLTRRTIQLGRFQRIAARLSQE